jgi:hypothetical protein
MAWKRKRRSLGKANPDHEALLDTSPFLAQHHGNGCGTGTVHGETTHVRIPLATVLIDYGAVPGGAGQICNLHKLHQSVGGWGCDVAYHTNRGIAPTMLVAHYSTPHP